MGYPVVTQEAKLLYQRGVGLTKKQVLRERVVDILSDFGNDVVVDREDGSQVKAWPSYGQISIDLGYRTNRVRSMFSRDELHEIEKVSLEIRRRRFSRVSRDVDDALVRRALSGDVMAMKLYYQRIEGWSEKQILAGDGENPIELNIGRLLDDVERSGRGLPGSPEPDSLERPADSTIEGEE